MAESSYTNIPILERANTIIELVADTPGGITSTDLLSKLEIPKTTLYRIMNFLLQHGYVQLNSLNNHYYIGIKFALLSKSFDEQVQLLKSISLPFLQKLADTIGQTTKLSILSNKECLVVAKAECSQQIKVTVDIGTKFPLHAGASSKILLSSLPDIEIQNYFAKPVTQFTKNTISDYEKMIVEISQIQKNNYAYDNGEYIENISAIAAPIRGIAKHIIGAVSIAFPTGTVSEDQQMTNIEYTKEIALQIDEALKTAHMSASKI